MRIVIMSLGLLLGGAVAAQAGPKTPVLPKKPNTAETPKCPNKTCSLVGGMCNCDLPASGQCTDIAPSCHAPSPDRCQCPVIEPRR